MADNSIEFLSPSTLMTPLNGAYHHAVVLPPGARVLHSAGQIGARPDGTVPEGAEAQAALVWENLVGILRAADMDVTDIVKLTAYVVGAENYPAYASARSRVLGTHRAAATAVCVASLLRPEWLIEVEMIAARHP
jgi:enamine deaminase RidA (YjgF/YER057c/UK114 family)